VVATVRRFWLGQQTLPQAFWLFGFVGFFGFGLLVWGLVRWPLRQAGLLGLSFGVTALLMWSYCIFAWIGIWRSADAYQGARHWAWAAKGAVCLFALMMLRGFFANGGFNALFGLLTSSN